MAISQNLKDAIIAEFGDWDTAKEEIKRYAATLAFAPSMSDLDGVASITINDPQSLRQFFQRVPTTEELVHQPQIRTLARKAIMGNDPDLAFKYLCIVTRIGIQ